MATDVLIQRCSLRIARRGGWSWGPDPRSLMRAAMLRLPELVAGRLGEMWPREVHGHAAVPLRLRIPLRLDELMALAGDTPASEAAAAMAVERAVAHRVDAVLRTWVEREAGRVAGPAPASVEPVPPGSEAPAPDPQRLWAGSVLAVLLGWERQGSLQAQLLSFTQPALAAWHDDLLRPGGKEAATHDAAEHAAVLRLAGECAILPLPLAPSLRASLVRRITFAVRCAQEFRLRPGDPLLHQALRAQRALDLPSPGSIDAAPAAGDPATPSAAVRAGHEPALPARTAPRTLPAVRPDAWGVTGDIEVASALPFLLLGPLSRTGYLLAVRAVFEAAQQLPRLPCLALALARKVLAPPQRGWLRSAEATTAARAFAGAAAPPADAELAELARQLAGHVSPLDATVAGSLCAGHTAGRPLLLQAARSGADAGWLLFEEEGLFPIAWAARIELLYARLAALGHELLLVPDAAVSGALLDTLDEAGLRFVTDAQPARGQAWRALHRTGLRAWSNDRQQPAEPLLAAAQRLDGDSQQAEALWRALTTERPGLPVGSEPALERSLALAAALALGTLAWSLWRERERVTPLLALQRFCDLSARVSYRADRVEVRLPLGRRFLDLQAARLLDDVPDVPWFDGRPVRFERG